MTTPRQWFRDAVADFKTNRTGPQRRARIREDVATLVTAGQKWLAEHDAQEATLPTAFAADKQGQFNTFVDGVAIVDADQEP